MSFNLGRSTGFHSGICFYGSEGLVLPFLRLNITFINIIIEKSLTPKKPKNKSINIIFSPLSRFIVYNSLKINMDLPQVGSKQK